MKYVIGNIFGRLIELNHFLNIIMESNIDIVFCGNYCDIGPYPFEVLDKIQSYVGKAEINFSYHDNLLLYASGIEPWPKHIKKRWINPYHGFIKTLSIIDSDWYNYMANEEPVNQKLRTYILDNYSNLIAGRSNNIYEFNNKTITDSFFVWLLDDTNNIIKEYDIGNEYDYFSIFKQKYSQTINDIIYISSNDLE